MAGVQNARQCLRARPLPASLVAVMLGQLVVYPEPPPPDLARTLDLGGYRLKAVAAPQSAAAPEPPDGWAGGLVACDTDPEGGWAVCRALRKRGEAPRVLLRRHRAPLQPVEVRG